jgi:thiamine pyrophosphate-dependent acetolactate synthase large subunit-like protein
MTNQPDELRLRRDIPVASAGEGVWGSDAIAELLRDLDIPYVLLNPGSSYRGLHDSLVNHLGNERPQMLLVLHEEHAVAIAHGYAKVTEQPLLAIVHSNVGLMHASMAVYNAWCDRLPVLLLGATGPVDAARRRPWIDWIHTSRDQGALVRGFVKWDDQPASVAAAFESLLRAKQIAQTAPKGPTYVCLDVTLQEENLPAMPRRPDVTRYRAPAAPRAAPELVTQAAAMLRGAARPLLLMGRVSRSVDAWNTRIALAEALNARVLTDLKIGAAFPTDHPLHAAPPGVFLTPDAAAVVRDADVILSLDWVDLAGTLKQGFGNDEVGARVIQVSMDQVLHNGINMDHQGLPPADLALFCDPESAVDDLAREVGVQSPRVFTHPCGVDADVSKRPDQHRHGGRRAARCVARARCVSTSPAAGVGRRHVALPPPTRLRRVRRRRRHRRRTGPHGGRSNRAQGQRAPARFDSRRWRLPDGRDSVLDGGQRTGPASRRRVQQPLVLQ